MRAAGPAARSIVVRAATEDDLDEVAAIERDVFADPWSRRSFVDLVDAPGVVFLVAADSDGVRGYAVVLVAAPESELANLATARNRQRQGLGRRLLEEALGRARGLGCREMFLEVRASNEAALTLYRSAGFHAVGRRARYYARPIEDAVVMKAVLER